MNPELAIYLCEHFTGQPTASTDHTALRWVDVHNLTELDWLTADRALLPAVAPYLTSKASADIKNRAD